MATSPSGSLIKPLVWITGVNGLIGNHLVQTALRLAPRWYGKFLLAKRVFKRKISA
jgi:hypothetical protein